VAEKELRGGPPAGGMRKVKLSGKVRPHGLLQFALLFRVEKEIEIKSVLVFFAYDFLGFGAELISV